MDVGALVQGIAQAGQNVVSGFELASNRKNMLSNIRYQSNANRMNTFLSALQMNREDTSIQRRVQDLKAAGLSPVLAAGSGASSSMPIKIEPEKAEMQSYPKFDTGGKLAEVILTSLLNQSQIKKNDEEIMRNYVQRTFDLESFPDRLKKIKLENTSLYEDNKTKALDNYYYKKYGIAPKGGSELGRTSVDATKITEKFLDWIEGGARNFIKWSLDKK
ncbi:MAG: DNA pilot protein [Arizlama microvirus]|nr:MAG: DNA pilot protein [Arizlama microvirus]